MKTPLTKKQVISRSLGLAWLLGVFFALPSANATIVYGNGATFGPDNVYQWNVDIAAGTSTLLRTYNSVGLQPNGNGRGVVVVGNTMYTTDSGTSFEGDNHIYMTDVTTGASLGSFTTTIPGTVNLSTLAWDGSQFWSSQYIGGGNAYRFGTDGIVTKTIDLGGYDAKDGMEWFNGKLIANRGDTVPPYDVYDLDGNLLTSSFINPGHGSTGIAYDGTYFLTVANFTSLDVWDGSGAFVKNIRLDGSFNPIEDLSVDYAQRADTGGDGVPDGGSMVALLGSTLVGLCVLRRRFLN
jgi:hypothetical protein